MVKAADIVLTPRALNRALLARQMLLERSAMPVGAAIAHLVGLQAQVPNDPYFALWSRLKDFDPIALSELIETRRAVRQAAMRGTIHLLAAADAIPLRALVQPQLARLLKSTPFGKETRGLDLAAAMKTARKAVEARAMTLAELRKVIAAKHPGLPATAASYVFHYTTALVQVPPRGLWRRSGAPRVTTAEAWLKGRPAKLTPAAVVLRYLAAFGPASVMDAQAWSGLTRLGPVFEKLRPRLAGFRDAGGRELFDLPEALRPDPDTPAPPRFLPVYDNATIGFANRDRILKGVPPRAVPQSVNVRSFLIDGFVAGFWKIDEAKGRATLRLDPFAKLAKKDAEALADEGKKLLAFAAPEVKAAVKFGRVY